MVRISNMSTPNECNQEGFSQSACGFVVEFTSVITKIKMNDTATNIGGWPASKMYKFLNDENDSNSIINLLPNDLKQVIIPTLTISGRAKKDSVNYTSSDKLYLLATAELWAQGTSNTIDFDAARDKTRQFDYYKQLGVTTNKSADAKKNDNTGAGSKWWLRSASTNVNNYFFTLYTNGEWDFDIATDVNGVSPAFRIG